MKKNRRKKNRSRSRAFLSFFFALRFKNISVSQEGKKSVSHRKSHFSSFLISRRIKHALKTRNTRHYLDLKYTFLIHTYFK